MATFSLTLTTGAKADPLLLAYYKRVRNDPSPTAAKVKAWVLQQALEMLAGFASLEQRLQDQEKSKAEQLAIVADVTGV